MHQNWFKYLKIASFWVLNANHLYMLEKFGLCIRMKPFFRSIMRLLVLFSAARIRLHKEKSIGSSIVPFYHRPVMRIRIDSFRIRINNIWWIQTRIQAYKIPELISKHLFKVKKTFLFQINIYGKYIILLLTKKTL